MTQTKTIETQTAETSAQAYKLTYGHTSETVKSANGISDRQIEAVAGILDIQIVRTTNEPPVLTITSTKSDKCATATEDVLIAAETLKYVLENNPAKPRELSINNIKGEIKNIRTALRTRKSEQRSTVSGEFEATAATNASTPATTGTSTLAQRHKKLIAKMELTQFQPGGNLVFNPSTGETWEPTRGQREFIESFPHKAALIVKGPAGSGKTEFTVRMALGMLANGETDQILISAPVDEGGEEIGFRKGSDQEKMNGHINQILEAIDGHLGQGDFKKGQKLRDELLDAGIIEITSLGVISGRNLRRKVMIVDEAHKAKMPHLLLCLSRVHTDGSKVILMGDERQHMSAGVSDFREFTKCFADPVYQEYVGQITYSADDIRRHPLPKLMSERGDDVPPGLKQKMQEEQMTFEKKALLLRDHFAKTAQSKKHDALSDKLAQEIIRRLSQEEVFKMLDEQLHGAPGNDL